MARGRACAAGCPFALTGGVYLLYALGYNLSVAVWVGFIALFGTAVQTGVVMVIYLEEAVARKRSALGGTLTRAGLRDAVVEGALLRLRPKVMTVSTVVAGLLPIMWSTSVGAEVMKPLATPVLGGMVSSLLHVLIVTPVLFLRYARDNLDCDTKRRSTRLVKQRRSGKRILAGDSPADCRGRPAAVWPRLGLCSSATGRRRHEPGCGADRAVWAAIDVVTSRRALAAAANT